MRLMMLVAVCAWGSLAACGKKTESALTETNLAAAARSSRIGGNVLAVGKYSVEVVLHAEGLVVAELVDAGGRLVETGGDTQLEVRAPTATGAREAMKLRWDAEQRVFLGHAATGVELRGGPLEVELRALGETVEGTLAEAAVVSGPRFGGELLAVGRYGSELRLGADGEVEVHLYDAKLQPVTGSAGLKLEAKVGERAVALQWDAPRACFLGHASLGAAVTPPRVELQVQADGKAAIGALARVALSGAARHGGVVVAAGDYSVELVTPEPGLVRGFVMDASGQAYARGDLKLQLGIGAAPPLALAYRDACACYEGKLDAALDLETKPVQLSLVGAGHAYRGAVASLRASATARAAADARARIEAPQLSASAVAGHEASARVGGKVSVKPPSVKVRAGAKAGIHLGTR